MMARIHLRVREDSRSEEPGSPGVLRDANEIREIEVRSVFVHARPKVTQGRGNGEKLPERHVQILEAALMVDPAIVIEDLVGNHERNCRQAVRNRELAWSSGESRFDRLLRNWRLR